MSSTQTAPVAPRASSLLRPIDVTSATIDGGFWARFQELNRDVYIQHCDDSLERVGWYENFRAAARGTLGEDRVGRLFTDSEIYKLMEALAWENARVPSAEKAQRLEELAILVEGAQEPDGYLNTFFGYEGGPERYSDLPWGHELYCYGHLLQAAVAVIRTGGPQRIVDVARRVADHICIEFGEGARNGLCGHPEIETALVEFYRATGEQRYLDMAKLFIERRGQHILPDTMLKGRDYYQDEVPIKEAKVLVGHSVRALYLAAGAVDVAVETGDDELFDAVKEQYDRTLERRTYLTGGMGSNHHGEAFGDDFELPSERAYSETCASVASVQLAWRLLLATNDVRYGDVIERTLYNSVVSSPSADGHTFFYVNSLHRRTPGIQPEQVGPSLRRTDGMRASWYTTSCCPTNMARLFSSLGGYLATTTDAGVQLHQYAEGRLDLELGTSGRRVGLEVVTGYPIDGSVRVRVTETDGEPWALQFRVPGWSTSATIVRDGETRAVEPGAAAVDRAWAVGDEVELVLDVAPRFTYPDPRIDAIRGCVAVERGPVIYALESVDNPGLDLDHVQFDDEATLADGGSVDDLGPYPVVRVAGRVWTNELGGFPYGTGPRAFDHGDDAELTLIPYFLWANRGSSTMRVWAPRAVARVEVPAHVGI
jgi:DUF1680 family protein